MAEPTPKTAPKLPEMIKMIAPDGGEAFISPDNYSTYLNQGFQDAELAAQEAASNLPLGDKVLGGFEALGRGATLGLSSVASDVGAGLAAEASGYQGPRAAGQGLDAAVDDTSNFMSGMQGAQRERQERAEGMGALGVGLEVAGGVVPMLLSGGAGLGARALAASPAALVEQLGQRGATRVIGQGAEQAALTLGQKIGRAALAGGIEGGLATASTAASENVPQIIENPAETAKELAITTAVGTTLGSAFGGGLGLISEGARRVLGRAEAIQPVVRETKPLVPDYRPVADALAAAPELEARANQLASQLPVEEKTLAQTFLQNFNAISREGEVGQAGVREATKDLTRLKQLNELSNEQLGIAAKRDFNREALQGTGAMDLTEQLDPDQALALGAAQNRRTAAQAQLDAIGTEFEAAQTAAGEAAARRQAAREALDAAGDPKFLASKSARARMKEMGLDALGTDELASAQQRVSDRITELQSQLTPPAAAVEPGPMTVKGRTTFDDGTEAVRYEVPGNKGRAAMEFPKDSDLATVSTIELASDAQRAGLGTRMYAQMFDDAQAAGRRFASDTNRAPKAQAWWEKQVAKGNATFDESINRFIMNKRPLPAANAPAAAPAGLGYELTPDFTPTGRDLTDQDTRFIQLMRDSVSKAKVEPGSFPTKDTARVFISDALENIPEAERAAVKAALPDMQRRGVLKMSRSDLVSAMDPKKVADSTVSRGSAKFNFIDTDSLGAKFTQKTAPAAPAAAMSAKDAARIAAELDDLTQIQRQLSKPPTEQYTALRKALKQADTDVAASAKRLEDLAAGRLTAEGAVKGIDDELVEIGAPRKMTRMESEGRAMFSETLSAMRKFAGEVAATDEQAALQLLRQTQKYSDLFKKFMAKGDTEGAYNAVDQGFKRSLADFVNSTKSGAAEEFAQNIHAAPQSFLERADLFGAAAERQKFINGPITKFMRAANDPAFKNLWADSAGVPASGWGNAKRARSEAVGSVMSQLGRAEGEGTERGLKMGVANLVESIAARAKDLGPEAQAMANEAATIGQRLFDNMDNVARAKMDADTVRGLLQSGQTTAGLAAMAGAVAGAPSLALPAVAGRWLLGAVMRQKNSFGETIAKGAAKLARGAAKTSGGAGDRPPRGLPTRQVKRAMLSKEQREKNLAHYREMSDITSPTIQRAAQAADDLNQQAPGLGDASLRHEIEVAQYVTAQLPKPPSTATFSPPPRLAPYAQLRLDRTLTAVGNPPKTLDRILRGYATDEDLDAMRTLYPTQYQQMVDAIMGEIERNPTKVDRGMHDYLSKVTGVPLTPALMSIGKNQARAQAATAGQEDTGKPQGQGANGADGQTARAPISIDVNEVYGTRADRIMQ